MNQANEAIVIGTRCTGSPTAMLLARRGDRVPLVDRAHFPSGTLSTHVIQPRGAAALACWGLLDRLAATGCPPIDIYAFDFGPVLISGAPGTVAAPRAWCPRRTILDKLLLDAAAAAGADSITAQGMSDAFSDAGTISPAEFFAPQNIGALLAA